MSIQTPTTTPTRQDSTTTWASLTLYGSLVAIGLMAGMYWDWDVAVMPGLARLDDRSFVDAMQNLIVAIENPGFFLVAFGAFGFPLTAAVLYAGTGQRQTALWIAAALALYVVGLVVTVAVHMPINYGLVDAGDPSKITDLAAARDDFGAPWRIANAIRTVTCVLALAGLGRAMVLHGRNLGPAPEATPAVVRRGTSAGW